MNPVFREKRLVATKTDKAHAESGNAVDTAASNTDKPALNEITREVQNGTSDRIAKASNDKAPEASAEEDQENVASASSAAPAASLDSDVAAADVTASPLEPACSSRAIASNVKPVFYSYSAAEAHLPPHLRKITRSSWRSPRERKKAIIGHVAPKVNAKKNSKPNAKKAAAPEDKAPNDIPLGMTVTLSCGKRTVRTVTQDAEEEAAIEASEDMGPESEDELEPAVKMSKAAATAKGKATAAAKSKAANGAKPEAAAAAAAGTGSKAVAAETSKAAAAGTSKATPAAKPKKLKVIAVEALKAVPAAKSKARTNTKRAQDEVDDDDVPQEDARPAKARKTAAEPKSAAEPKLTTVAPVAEAPTPLRTDRERGLRRTVKVVDYKTML
ncbi:hypothetical protein K525DRAFT_251937 [Schizophyllum commune Loenen D]|nr:hypothetical protein K525DRAFT_251937 [Schizophyllum commune Loenen D]